MRSLTRWPFASKSGSLPPGWLRPALSHLCCAFVGRFSTFGRAGRARDSLTTFDFRVMIHPILDGDAILGKAVHDSKMKAGDECGFGVHDGG